MRRVRRALRLALLMAAAAVAVAFIAALAALILAWLAPNSAAAAPRAPVQARCLYRYRYGSPPGGEWVKIISQPCAFRWRAAIECRYYLLTGGYTDRWFYGQVFDSAGHRSTATCTYDPPEIRLHAGYETRNPGQHWRWHTPPNKRRQTIYRPQVGPRTGPRAGRGPF